MIKKYSQFISESVIHTYNIIDNINTFKNQLNKLNIDYNINIISKLTFEITINNLVESDYIKLLKIIKLFGYFCSKIIENIPNNLNNLNKDITVKKKFAEYTWRHNNYITIIVEANYEDSAYNNIPCPDVLYHLTYEKNLNNILRLGLYPKSKSKLTNHDERIYLFNDIVNYKSLLNSLKTYEYSKLISVNQDIPLFCLLEINCSVDKLILHTDPNYLNGYYTYNNINKNNIKVIESSL